MYQCNELVLEGKALEDFRKSKINKTNDVVGNYINFFKTIIPIKESKWYDYTLQEEVKVFIIDIGERELFFYNESELILRLNNDYNQEFNILQ